MKLCLLYLAHGPQFATLCCTPLPLRPIHNPLHYMCLLCARHCAGHWSCICWSHQFPEVLLFSPFLRWESGGSWKPPCRTNHPSVLAHLHSDITSQTQGSSEGLAFYSRVTWFFTFSSAAEQHMQACVCKGHGIQIKCTMHPFLLQKARENRTRRHCFAFIIKFVSVPGKSLEPGDRWVAGNCQAVPLGRSQRSLSCSKTNRKWWAAPFL